MPDPGATDAGTSPVTKAPGKKRAVVARFVRNRHLADACYQWAFCSTPPRLEPRAFYDEHRGKGEFPRRRSPGPVQPPRRHTQRVPAQPHPL
jgi:hypothetical protein